MTYIISYKRFVKPLIAMKYQSHILIAVSVVTALKPWNENGVILTALIYGLAILGSLLPDIDHPHSFFGSKIPVIPTILYRFDGHRGVTHSLFGLIWAAIFGIILANTIKHLLSIEFPNFGQIIPNSDLTKLQNSRLLIFSLGIGYLTHLLADFITNKGIPIFWPVRQKYVLKLATTGSIAEYAIILYVAVTCMIYATWNWISTKLSLSGY